jgi:hypothetical protein
VAVKSIVEIDVQDEKFQAFLKLFERYQETLSKTGDKWKSVGKETDNVAASVADMTAAMMAQVELLNDENYARRKADREEQQTEKRRREGEKQATRQAVDREKAVKKTADHAKSIAVSVGRTGLALAKWGAFGVVGGLLGGGAGLWGLGRLADSASNARRSAMGLGTTTAGMQSFGLNFGRVVGGDHLSRIADAQANLSDQWAFSALGMANARDRDPAELAAEMLPRAIALYNRGGRTMEAANAYGLTKFYSRDELERGANMSPAELAERQARFRADARQNKLMDETSRKWQDLSEQLTRAKWSISNTLIDALVPLTPKLTALSERFTKLIGEGLKSEKFGKFVDKAADQIERFATYLGSDKFTSDFGRLSQSVGDAARNIADAARWINDVVTGARSWVPGTPEHAARKQQQWEAAPNWMKNPLGAVRDWGASFVKPITEKRIDSLVSMTNAPSKYDAMFQEAGAKYGVDWRELKLRAATESNLNPGAWGPQTKYGRAVGLMQVNAKAHGYDPVSMLDPARNIDAGAKIWADALRRAGGDPNRAAAIYYGSPGKPNSEQYAANDAAVRARMGLGANDNIGSSVRAYAAPREVPRTPQNDALMGAVDRAVSRAPGGSTVTVYNATGGNAAVAVNQVAR